MTVAEARVVSGISVTLISDADMTELIEDIEFQIERYLNSNFTPTIEIDRMDGNAQSSIFSKRSPMLSLRFLSTNDVEVSIASTKFEQSGRIRIQTGTESQIFTQVKDKVFIKYVFGRVEWDKINATTTDAASIAGTSIALSVVSETGFTTGDWIEIYGTDGNREAAQITATDTGEITVDELAYAHNSGSLVRLVKIAAEVERLIKIWVGIAAVTRAVGQSFDDITGYTMGEFQVQKGEPFTQFRETIIRLEKEGQDLMDRLHITPGIVM